MQNDKIPPRTPVRVNTEQLQEIEELTVEAVAVERQLWTPADILDHVIALGIAAKKRELAKMAKADRQAEEQKPKGQ